MEHVFSNKDGALKNDSPSRNNTQVQHRSNLGQAVQMAAVNPGALTSRNIAQMQKTLGNKAVTQLLSQHTIQRAPEDDDEIQFKTLQRAKGPEEEEPLQGKFPTIQRAKSPEEEEPLQGKFQTIQRAVPEEDEVQT